jgi:Flp pilus assembly protein TadB
MASLRETSYDSRERRTKVAALVMFFALMLQIIWVGVLNLHNGHCPWSVYWICFIAYFITTVWMVRDTLKDQLRRLRQQEK